MRTLILIILCLQLVGCKLWGSGTGSGDLIYDHRCKVRIDTAETVANADDGDATLDININPDCSVDIDARRVLGDSVIKIENPQGTELIETGTPGEGMEEVIDGYE